MEILVNDKPLDFVIDKTLNLSEILDHVQEWALKENMFILDYKVNGNAIERTSNAFNSDNIDVLSIDIGSKQILVWENINELESYIQKIKTYLVPRLQESENFVSIDNEQLLAGMSWIIRSIDSLNNYFNVNETRNESLNEESLQSLIDNENYVALLGYVQSIEHYIHICKKKLFYNLMDKMEATELQGLYLHELTLVLGSLEKIASDLTVGKDGKALKSLENIMEWLSMGLVVFEKSGKDNAIMEKIQNALEVIEDCLKNSDFVSLADTIDFDLRDALAALLK